MSGVKQKLRDIDNETLSIIYSNHDILNILYDFSGYIQMCNKEIVEIKKAVNHYMGVDIHPLNDEQKTMLKNGGDALKDIRKIIKSGKVKKDKEVANAYNVETQKS